MRLLHERLQYPLRDEVALKQRLSHIEYFLTERGQREALRKLFHSSGDLPRLLSKILYRKAQATKIQRLMLSLQDLL